MVWLPAIIHWLHLLAAATWLGGSIFAAFVANPVLRSLLAPEARVAAFKEIGRRFGLVQLGCITVLAATGTWKLLQRGAPLFDGAFGALLCVKLSLVAAVLGLSAVHASWGRRLASLPAGRPDAVALSRRLVFWARVELAALASVMLCGAMLRMNPF